MPAVRTSKTHLLHVDWVKAPAGHAIGITIGPGKKTTSLEGDPWERDVATERCPETPDQKRFIDKFACVAA